MEVSFKRQFNHSYMILSDLEGLEESHDLEVLAYNEIPGLLKLETEEVDGQNRYWYDITGKQTLGDYLERRMAESGLLELIFRKMEEICLRLSEYLLGEEHVLLRKEYLFLDVEGKQIEFLYLPAYGGDIRDSFQELMEELLQKLNHSDRQALALCYEMYQQSLQREKPFSDMIKLVFERWKDNQGGNGIDVAETVDRKDGGEEEGMIERDWAKRTCPLKDRDTHMEIEKEAQVNFGERMNRGRQWLKQRFNTKKSYMEEPIFALPGEIEEPVSYPTEVLHMQGGARGILCPQCMGNRPEITIDKPIFIIGKKEKEVDACINGKSISRIHARIEKEGESYYVEDMNSTNGTYVNGECLEFRQKVRLEPGDRVDFGEEKYLFQ